MRATRYLADFDSTSSMLYALARCLAGRGFAGAGVAPSFPRLAGLVNALPRRVREELYRRAGWWEAWPPSRIAEVEAEAISQWVAAQYPERRYPGVFLGATHGGAMHIAAALGMPWLPQTFLLPLRRTLDPDDLAGDLEWGRAPAQALVARNPELAVHQMHDPVHDRLMVTRMAYFRIKRRRLGPTYRELIARRVAPGGPFVIVDCRFRRPATHAGPLHLYQAGGLGGTRVDEYLHGGPRVAAFLAQQAAAVRSWTPPRPDEEAPEAEWGYLNDWDEEILALAASRGHPVRRLVFDDPQDLSGVVADLYVAWLERRGLPARRLLAENFALVAPWHALACGLVPFWLPFNTEPADAALERYLSASGPFDDIYLMLLSNGVDAIGLVPLARWRALIGRARRTGRLLGVDERAYPRDFASFVRYYTELERHAGARVPPAGPLSIDDVDRLMPTLAPSRGVRWEIERT